MYNRMESRYLDKVENTPRLGHLRSISAFIVSEKR